MYKQNNPFKQQAFWTTDSSYQMEGSFRKASRKHRVTWTRFSSLISTSSHLHSHCWNVLNSKTSFPAGAILIYNYLVVMKSTICCINPVALFNQSKPNNLFQGWHLNYCPDKTSGSSMSCTDLGEGDTVLTTI